MNNTRLFAVPANNVCMASLEKASILWLSWLKDLFLQLQCIHNCYHSIYFTLVDRYGITVSQMISDMFLMSLLQYPSLFTNVTYRIRLFTGFVQTYATRRVPNVEQDLSTLPEHLRSSSIFGCM